MSNKTTYLLIFAILLLSTSTIILYLNQIKIKNKTEILIRDLELKNNNNIQMIDYLITKDMLQFLSENSTIKKDLMLKNIENESIKFNSLFNDSKPLIILKISDEYCFSCYDPFFEILKDHLENTDLDESTKIIVLSSFDNIREMKLSFNSTGLDLDLYIIKEKQLFEIDKFHSPYMFTVSTNNICSNFYAINRSDIPSSKKYLNYIFNLNK